MIVQRQVDGYGRAFFKSMCIHCGRPILFAQDVRPFWYHAHDDQRVCEIGSRNMTTTMTGFNALSTSFRNVPTYGSTTDNLATYVTGGYMPNIDFGVFYKVAEPEMYEITELGVLA